MITWSGREEIVGSTWFGARLTPLLTLWTVIKDEVDQRSYVCIRTAFNMNPTAFGKSLSGDSSSENDANSVLGHDSRVLVEACVVTGQDFFTSEDKDQNKLSRLKNELFSKTNEDKVAEMIFKPEPSSAVNSCFNSRYDRRKSFSPKPVNSTDESSSTSRPSSKLTDIVKEITEKKRQTFTDGYDINSTIRGRFAINGVTASSSKNLRDEGYNKADVCSEKTSSSAKIGKVNRRKQRPHKTISVEEKLPLASSDTGVHCASGFGQYFFYFSC